MKRGKSPAGKAYWPAFPYPAFTQMTEQDLGHLWAWLQTLEPVSTPNRNHDTRRTRLELGMWRMLGFKRGGRSWERAEGEHARGAYLGNAIGHCGECHTPRNGIGIPQRRDQHGGTDAPPEPAPSIRAAELDWSLGELSSFLEDGWTPEGDVIGGEMGRIVAHGTSKLSIEDRRALAAWVLSIGQAPAD